MRERTRRPAITAYSAASVVLIKRIKILKFRRLEELSADEALKKIEEEMK